MPSKKIEIAFAEEMNGYEEVQSKHNKNKFPHLCDKRYYNLTPFLARLHLAKEELFV